MKYNDQNIAKALSKGDRKAFHHLYDLYFKELFLFANKLLDDEQEAEDAVQNIFIKLYETRTSFKEGDNIKAWLYRSVQNKCFSEIRHQKVVEKYQKESAYLFKEESSSDNDLKEIITLALDELTKEQREVFELSRIQGYKNREIAEKINKTEKNVEYHMGNALKKLRATLKKYLDTDG